MSQIAVVAHYAVEPVELFLYDIEYDILCVVVRYYYCCKRGVGHILCGNAVAAVVVQERLQQRRTYSAVFKLQQVGVLYVYGQVTVCRMESEILIVVTVELKHVCELFINIHAVVAKANLLGKDIAPLIFPVYI